MKAILWLLLVLGGMAPAQDEIPRLPKLQSEYRSPDGLATATIHSAPLWAGESVVQIRTRYGKLLAERDFSSEDHEHGYVVVQARWTPDSKFFVFCLESSGGHSPMRTPVLFFSTVYKEFFVLDELLKQAVSQGQFHVIPPDIVSVQYDSAKKWKGSLFQLLQTQKHFSTKRKK